jgi:hypothetical protein
MRREPESAAPRGRPGRGGPAGLHLSVLWSLAIQEPEFTSARDGPAASGGGQLPAGQRNLGPDHDRRHDHAGARLAGFCLPGPVVELLMGEKRGDAGRKRVGPADPAKLRWHLPVIQGGIITAQAADDLEPAGAAVRIPVAGARRPAPKCHCPARLVLVTTHLHGSLAEPAVHAAFRCGLSRCLVLTVNISATRLRFSTSRASSRGFTSTAPSAVGQDDQPGQHDCLCRGLVDGAQVRRVDAQVPGPR